MMLKLTRCQNKMKNQRKEILPQLITQAGSVKGGIEMKELPKIALGTWSWGVGAVGGDQVFGNHVGEKELKPVFDLAMRNGLNLWDTAYVYGMGASESVLGKLSKNCRREDIVFSTKFTPDIAGNGENPVEEMWNGSCQRLGTDYIDIYWIHNPGDVEKWTPQLIPLAKSGKIKRIGVSNHNMEQIKRAEEILSAEGLHISAVQNHYSLIYRSSEDAGILKFCSENHMDFFAYMVLEQGALSGKYNAENLMPEESQRGKTYNPILPKLGDVLEALSEIGKKHDATAAQVAVAWAIGKGTIPIIGVTKAEQVEDAAKAAGIVLEKEECEHLERLAKDSGVDTRGSWEKPMI